MIVQPVRVDDLVTQSDCQDEYDSKRSAVYLIERNLDILKAQIVEGYHSDEDERKRRDFPGDLQVELEGPEIGQQLEPEWSEVEIVCTTHQRIRNRVPLPQHAQRYEHAERHHQLVPNNVIKRIRKLKWNVPCDKERELEIQKQNFV